MTILDESHIQALLPIHGGPRVRRKKTNTKYKLVNALGKAGLNPQPFQTAYLYLRPQPIQTYIVKLS